MVAKWTHTPDTALPQVLALLVQYKMHNRVNITHNTAFFVQCQILPANQKEPQQRCDKQVNRPATCSANNAAAAATGSDGRALPCTYGTIESSGLYAGYQ